MLFESTREMRGGVALRSTRSQYSWALSRVPDAVQLSTPHRTRVCFLRAEPAGDIETEKLTGSLQQVRKAAFNTITQDPSTAPGRHRRRPALLPCPPRLFRPKNPYRPWSHAQGDEEEEEEGRRRGAPRGARGGGAAAGARQQPTHLYNLGS